ncbi:MULTISPECIES: organic hydroperoxide resistance protein [unclassified Streptomyces]|uniref:organic hydroperoxide resistance protein n=1 Tax=unclassified Streptomyces TaxID=2593676 RepID=UPI00166147AB|nr:MULTISPECIES: organic hydroperoxide resistance protein [unclassified Streptomyces]MBD0707724.1 organic hydroperoxide resistance protein [Streptomyces sp. CBMA291]MBD0714941.1 organic hydroperoxide resistance protein [Streptomyces sp. CBMA370]
MAVVYTAEVTSTGDGRNGAVLSSDGLLDLPLASPKAVGGSGGATNPEQLFAAGYAACFHSALRVSARASRTPLADDTVTAEVALHKEESGFRLSVVLSVVLPGLDAAEARRLAEEAHGRCPYSKAIRGNVEVRVDVTA